MRDLGHEWTERRIAELEKRIREAYEEACDDLDEKIRRYVARFVARDRELREQLKAGKITKADYQMWLNGQVFQGKRWQATLDDLTATLARANQIAMQIIAEEQPEAFAYNANWASYTMERQLDASGYDLRRVQRPEGKDVPPEKSAGPRTAATVRFGWGLYDADAVKLLLRDEPRLLPPPSIDIPVDRKWNLGNISRQIMQGIVQGESVEQVAQRLRRVEEMNIDSARTHARTAMTGAQNAGREEAYERLERRGFRVEREWIATLDGYTRELHAKLDGQHKPVGEEFEVSHRGRTYRIMFPGDPHADPRMVYNCRCTTGAWLPDFPYEEGKRRDDDPDRVPIRDMTFREWLEWKRGETGLKNAVGHVIIEVKKTTAKGAPGSITQTKTAKGGIDRNYYGDDGEWIKQISDSDHGYPKKHPYGKHGEHAHDIIWQDGRIAGRTTRELNEEERKENDDIL